MAKRHFALWIILAVTGGCMATAADEHLPRPAADVSAVPVGDVASVVTSNTSFAVDLYTRLAANTAGNVIFSPHSMSTALAMTFAGAGVESDTARQMASTLHFDLPRERVHPAFAATLLKLNQSIAPGGETTLSIANSLWGQTNYGFQQPFIQLVRDHYDAPLTEVDFIQQREAASKSINGWVSDATAGKIKELISPNMINQYTRLVLVNAVYFNGKWREPFKKSVTRDLPFHLTSADSVPVPTMHQEESMAYFGDDSLQAVELAYKDSKLAMLLLVPKEIDGVAALDRSLSAERLHEILSQLRRREVALWLPRFKFDARFELSNDLKAMGMPDAFDEQRADFSQMASHEQLFISFVIHKAVIEVNEKGTEAAAATGVGMGVTSAPAQLPPQVRADRPFVFLIRDRETGSILFMGRVSDPRG
jgi:serpin B